MSKKVKCEPCNGTGLADHHNACVVCKGSGKVKESKEVAQTDSAQTDTAGESIDASAQLSDEQRQQDGLAYNPDVNGGIISAFNEVPEGGNPTGGVTYLVNSVINWQDGIIDGKQNGAFVEDVITAAITRLEYFQNSKFNCQENADAIEALCDAMSALGSRTKAREAQGVENTYETHTSPADSNPPAAGDVEVKEYRVLENDLEGGVEYPKGTVHEPGSILVLTDVEVEGFAPGLLELVDNSEQQA